MKKCPHGKEKYFCKGCGGKGICEHGVAKSRCRECKGSQICKHGRDKRNCAKCGTHFCIHKRQKDLCKECGGLQAVALGLYRNAKSRAKKKGVPFNITKAEILELIGDGKCPIFGTPYNLSARRISDTSANLDRTFPDLGYTKRNCVVMSNIANRIKTNATTEELRKVLVWMEKHVEPIVLD